MGREIYITDGSTESRPGILLIGAPNVGKRTILSRLLSIDIPDASDLSGGILSQGWTIDNKYYSADVSVWTAHLTEDFSLGTLPISHQLAGLVMVFDMSDESSFFALKDWVGNIDLEKFDILLCIGNKADLVSGHSAHAEYRRYLQKHGESSIDPHPEFWDYGIDEVEGCSLLGDEEPSQEISKSCFEWCIQHNIEFVEACASNADFDKCLSVHGDIQGVQRLSGVLSAHMWPGMVMKSGERMNTQFPVEKEETTDDESDYEVEYEVLSGGADEQWEYVGVSHSELPSTSTQVASTELVTVINGRDLKQEIADSGDARADITVSEAAIASRSVSDNLASEIEQNNERNSVENQLSASESNEREEVSVDAPTNVESDEDSCFGHEDLERLMSGISVMRDNLRLMPDFQRREMAAKMAMKMAVMFGDDSDVDDDRI